MKNIEINNVNHKTQELVNSLKNKEKIRVLFVCLGNICRSPAAEGVLRSIVEASGDVDKWVIDSGGMGGWHVGELPDQRMRVHAKARGLTLEHRCRRVTSADFDDFDIIIGMDSMNIEDLREMAPSPEAMDKIVPMAVFVDKDMHCDHIPDPYYDGAEGFERVLDLLQNGCNNLYNLLK